MKKVLFIITLMLLPILASAAAVEINGIYYNLVKKTKKAEVTSNPNQYNGEVVIPESVPYDGEDYSVTSIGNGAFSGCSGLTSVIIPNSVTSIGELAFDCCSGLTSVTIPNSVTSIGMHAFSCSGLTSITIPNSVTSISGGAFTECSGLVSVTIPNSVTTIGGSAFVGCSSLTSITIPSSVTSIGAAAFARCSSLTSVSIPNSVTSIGDNAFSGCSGLTSLTIGNKIETIYEYAFASCPDLTDVYCYAEKVPNTNTDAFQDSYIEYATLHVPAASVNAYKDKEPWKNFKSIVALDGSTPGTKKCATPTISYVDGKLVFSCATDGVEYQYDYKSTGSGSGNNVELKQIYTVSVYATKSGYDNSDVATKEINISSASGSGILGDLNNDGKTDAADVVTLVNIIAGKKAE